MDAYPPPARGTPPAPPGEVGLAVGPPVEVLEALQHRVVTGEAHEAIPGLEQLCADDPAWVPARLSLGIAYLRVGRVDEAQDALEVAERLAPANFSVEVAWAEFHARLGFFDRAVTRLDRALGIPAPSQHALSAAMDLQRYSRERARKLYYRQLVWPRWPFGWPKRFASRAAALNISPARSIEA